MTVDPHWDKVVLALPMTGANNSTTFTDVSPSPKTITRYGNTKISTAQAKWGQGSGLFSANTSGISDHVRTELSSGIGTQPFTIQSWIYPTATSNAAAIIPISDFRPNATWDTLENSDNGFLFYFRGLSNKIAFLYGSGSTLIEGTSILSANSWYHFLGSRDSSNTLRLFINGQLESTANNVTNNFSRTRVSVGGYPTMVNLYDRFMQDVSLHIGVALATADFTPPSEPMFTNRGAISGTVYEKNQAGVYVSGAYPVRVYRRADGVLAASTTSAADGTYTIDTLPIYDAQLNPIEYYAVALDTAATWQSPGLKEQVFPT
jgi:hypothetical protein